MVALLLGGAAAALAALFADAGVELGPLLSLGGFSALLANFGVERRPKLLLHSLAAFFADAGVSYLRFSERWNKDDWGPLSAH